MHMSGSSHAQRHAPIIQGDLRHGAEEEFAGGFERSHFRYQERRQARAQQVGDAAFGGGEREDPVGGGHQFAGKRDALGFVGGEQFGLGTAAQYGREFPGQIDRIANPGIHALAAGGAVHMGGVAQ
ncbi:hypothetical protein D3C71_927890 [compost metagenome]